VAGADSPAAVVVAAAVADGNSNSGVFSMTSSMRLILTFSGALFISASLLFSVQPMISKMVLPILGGTPAVWITAMVFFQGALLAGYAYAYTIIKFVPLKGQIIIHLVALSLALLVLPMSISESWGTPDWQRPQIWLLTVFMGVVALPFVAASGSTTLLQSWFSHSEHEHASDPYFLYAASNAGSLLALIAYPTILEPLFTISEQTGGWTIVYYLLIALIAFCGIDILRSPKTNTNAGFGDTANVNQPLSIPWSIKMQWLGLSFAPSMLLLGATLFIQTDIAAIPFFWVAPLAIYLLTFIVAFARRQLISRRLILILHAISLVLVTLIYSNMDIDYRLTIAIHMAFLFFSGLVCHGSLASLRPSTEHLAEFYLWISVGGWLGGIMGGVFAPLVFDSVLEYPLAIIIVCLFRGLPIQDKDLRVGVPWLAALTLTAYWYFNPWFGPQLTSALSGQNIWLIYCGIIGTGIMLVRNKPISLTLLTAVVLFTSGSNFFSDDAAVPLYQDRSFFGVSKVMLVEQQSVHTLISGTTIHGQQFRAPELQRTPTTYHSRVGPIGQLVTAFRNARGIRNVGVAGLGAGASTCLFEGDENVTFFEIDPTVVTIATTPELFSFIELCGENTTIELGDARILIEAVPDESLDILLLDAFSSDAVPVHLLTDEAIRLYFQKISPGGIVAFHISNRYVDLQPILSRVALEQGLKGLRQPFIPSPRERSEDGAWDATVVVLARSEEDLTFLRDTGRWLFLGSIKPGDHWTDDFSNVLGSLVGQK
jgi:hypothetical protein